MNSTNRYPWLTTLGVFLSSFWVFIVAVAVDIHTVSAMAGALWLLGYQRVEKHQADRAEPQQKIRGDA